MEHELVDTWIRMDSGNRWHCIRDSKSTYCGIKGKRRFERTRDVKDVPEQFVCKRCIKKVKP